MEEKKERRQDKRSEVDVGKAGRILCVDTGPCQEKVLSGKYISCADQPLLRYTLPIIIAVYTALEIANAGGIRA